MIQPSRVKPIRDEVYVRVIRDDAVRGGIHIPTAYVKPSRQGVVLALGPRCQGDVGIGDQVLLPERAKSRVQQYREDHEYWLVHESELLGTVEA